MAGRQEGERWEGAGRKKIRADRKVGQRTGWKKVGGAGRREEGGGQRVKQAGTGWKDITGDRKEGGRRRP
jgi:hypothetical protein